jgi:pimeloyl-ACP methyl ester carboxylesterase
MTDSLPVVFVPGFMASPRFYSAQLPAMWRFGPVTVADHTRADSMAEIARGILAAAPPRFALIGHSMGGYIAFEIMRQAADRVARLALLDTAAPADTPEQTQRRKTQIERVQSESVDDVFADMLPVFLHPLHVNDPALRDCMRAMANDNGREVFVRQLTAMMHRPDSRPTLAAIRCPTLVVVGDGDAATPPERAKEIAAGIAGARLVVIPNCGHMTAIEQPEAVTRALVDWMDVGR